MTWDPLAFDTARLDPLLSALTREATSPQPPSAMPPARSITVPVAYGGDAGPDLELVAREAGLTPEEVVRRHSSRPYRVHFLGFAPGFAYMGDVDPAIAVPRLATPRSAVPAGSVGIAGRQTGVYPRATPGGWRLIGRTPLRVYDPARPEPALFRQGDDVVFVATKARLPGEAPSQRTADVDASAAPVLHVLRPGLLTTLQDLGRPGYQADGVSPAGAADPLAARLANRVVGNDDGAAVLEITALGPTLAVLSDVALAVVGADLAATIDGVPLPTGLAVRAQPGSTIAFAGPLAGCRAYLAVAGGLAAAPVLGSRASDPLGGLGPAPLRAGDMLGAYPSIRPAADLVGRRLRAGAHTLPKAADPLDVGVLRGPQSEWFEPHWWSPDRPAATTSDRVGLRLEGERAMRRAAWADHELLSEPNVLGAVQVPPDGRPVVLLAGRPTVGGYPKPGVVCTVDAWRLAQVLPGAGRVRMRPMELAKARAKLSQVRDLLSDRSLVVGT